MARASKRVRRDCPAAAAAPADSSDSSKTPSPNRISKYAKAIPLPPQSPSSAQKTAEHLRQAGWRGFVAVQSVESATFCVCVAPETEFDIEEAIRCCHRNCEVSYFHLACMRIPDHPPRSIGWMCPACRIKHKSQETGLYDLRGNGEREMWRDWLGERRRKKETVERRREKETVEGRRKKEILKPGGEISRLFGEEFVEGSERRKGALKRKRGEEQDSERTLTAEEDSPDTLAREDPLSTLNAEQDSSSTLAVEHSPSTLAEENQPTALDSASSVTSELTEFDSEDEEEER